MGSFCGLGTHSDDAAGKPRACGARFVPVDGREAG
jgi:hypothetical protein